MNKQTRHRIVIIGGGPGGYSAALSGSLLGADVTLIEDTGIGGSAVLTDVIPSKTLIASAANAAQVEMAYGIGVGVEDDVKVNAGEISRRVRELVRSQSENMRENLLKSGVRVVDGRGKLAGPGWVSVEYEAGAAEHFPASTVVLAVGARPRTMPAAAPDGRRILTWKQLYDLKELPEHLIVVGSGVTGAEFASAYRFLGSEVTLISSRERVLPGEDEDAAREIQEVFVATGMQLLQKSRADRVEATEDGVQVTLADGRTVVGSHCLIAVGAIPNTADLGLESTNVQLDDIGRIQVNGVACSTVPGIYAAGDCSNFLPLASVAEMQGRTAVFHAMGENVIPIQLKNLAANVFTIPEIATAGRSQKDIDEGRVNGQVFKVDLSTNPRAKMMGWSGGFIKLIAAPETGTVLGGVVVAPIASELIFPISVAVQNRLTVDQLAQSFAIFPSLTLSLWHAARALHVRYENPSRG